MSATGRTGTKSYPRRQVEFTTAQAVADKIVSEASGSVEKAQAAFLIWDEHYSPRAHMDGAQWRATFRAVVAGIHAAGLQIDPYAA